MEKAGNRNSDPAKAPKKIISEDGHIEIKTDLPLSEKDEIKKAEERLRKAVKKTKTS